MTAPRDTRGLPPDLYDEGAALLGVDRMRDPIDPWFAFGLPGSWEWALPAAMGARHRFHAAGWGTVIDPAAPWRVLWRRLVRRGGGE
jgi:hypothetical protein